VPRDLPIPGRELQGVHFAMDFLTQQNKRIAGDVIAKKEELTAKDKNVIVLGGGDTGSDCVGTSRRQGAASITQIELLPMPPKERSLRNPWPTWPFVLRTSSSHEEGCERLWSITTKAFAGENGKVKSLQCAKLEWLDKRENGGSPWREIPDSCFELKADLVLLAMGFIHVEHGPLVQEAGLEIDGRGNLKVDANLITSVPGVFAAGDSVMGASLVVKALQQGRLAAEGVNRFLT